MVLCGIMECKSNRAGKCDKKIIEITWKVSGEFRNGERVCYPVCDDCEEEEED